MIFIFEKNYIDIVLKENTSYKNLPSKFHKMKMANRQSAMEHLERIPDELNKLIQNEHDYAAFALITIGIEFLGSFRDNYDYETPQQSEARFKLGLEVFTDTWYFTNRDILYQELRGPLLHRFHPGTKFLLTSFKKNNSPLNDHKEIEAESTKTILVIEQFVADFKSAIANYKGEKTWSKKIDKDKPKIDYTYLDDFNRTGGTTEKRHDDESVSRRARRAQEREKRKNH